MEARARGMFRRHREGSTALTETVANKYYPNAEDCRVLHTSTKKGRWVMLCESCPKIQTEVALHPPSKRTVVNLMG